MLTTPTHSHKYGVNATTANSQAQADEPFASARAKSRMDPKWTEVLQDSAATW